MTGQTRPSIRWPDLLRRVGFSDCLPNLIQPLPVLSLEVGNEVFALLGRTLPSGSTKFISVLGMLTEFHKLGVLRGCKNMVVSSSGNTGIAAAECLYGSGIRLHVVVDPRTALGKFEELSRWDAEVVLVEAPDEKSGWLGARLQRVQQLCQRLPDAVDLDQYGNIGALEAHYEFTGNFVWRQLQGRIDVAIAPIGTGGTAGGTFSRLRELSPVIKTIAVDCEGSGLMGGTPRPHLLTGIGAQFACTNVLRAYSSMTGFPPQIIGDEDAFRESHWLLRHEGISVGGSAGAAVAAVRRVSRRLAGQRMLIILPDGGEAYRETIFNPLWLLEHGLNINSKEGTKDVIV